MSVLSNDDFFAKHPEKVLGEETTVSNRFGRDSYTVLLQAERHKALETIKVPMPKDHFLTSFNSPKPSPSKMKTKQTPKPENVAHVIEKSRMEKVDHELGLHAGCGKDMHCFDDVFQKYNSGITEAEVRAWVWYQTQSGGIMDPAIVSRPENGWSRFYEKKPDLNGLVKAGALVFDGQEYVPSAIYFSGNIYEKIQRVRRKKELLIQKLGMAAYEQLLKELEAAKPRTLSITGDESRRLYIDPKSELAESFMIGGLRDTSPFEEPKSLQAAFMQDYIYDLDTAEIKQRFGANRRDIIGQYFDSRPIRNASDSEKLQRRRSAEEAAKALFAEFLEQELLREDQQKIDYLWNSTYNHFKPYDYNKIPVGFEVSAYFKKSPLQIRPAQREGVAFLTVTGSGHVAYDVGLGKTMTSILYLAQGFYCGMFKRPIVAVPKNVYHKWLAEISGKVDKAGNKIAGILPQVKVYDLHNLGDSYLKQITNDDGQIEIPEEQAILLMTKEGLRRMGFGEETEKTLVQEVKVILSQNEGAVSERKQALVENDIEDIVSRALIDTKVDIEELGADCLITDETHFFKNIFSDVKGELKDPEAEGRGRRTERTFQIQGAKPSQVGVKAFMLSQYILKNNHLRNVVGLTATPFTNNPLEIYSMLSLVAYRDMQQMGIRNISTFFSNFVNETWEEAFTSKGRYSPKKVIKSFNNLPVLQELIYKYINYKLGEEVGIERPEKIVLPMLTDENGVILPAEKQISTFLQPTQLQKDWFGEISMLASPNRQVQENSRLWPYIELDDKGRPMGLDLLIITFGRTCALSPYLLRAQGDPVVTRPPAFSPKVFVESAPKIYYAIKCMESVVNYHRANKEPISGQVLFMSIGTQAFEMIRDYIAERGWLKADEIGIIDGKTTESKREKIKNDFLNPQGTIKLILGSSAILVGVDLQNQSSVLYNLTLPWNPTDVRQLEGRIWRFGNIFEHIRIVNPLVENSVDAFLFQLLYEKTARINNIWQRGQSSSALNIDEFNPQELRDLVITDPVIRADREISNQLQLVEAEIAAMNIRKESMRSGADVLRKLSAHEESFEKHLQKGLEVADRDWLQGKDTNDVRIQYQLVRKFASRIGYEWGVRVAVDNVISSRKRSKALLKSLAGKLDDGADTETILQQEADRLNNEIEAAEERQRKLKSDKYRALLVARYQQEIDEREVQSRGMADVVKEFTSLNYLLSCNKLTGKSCDTDGIVHAPKMSPVEISVPIPEIDDSFKNEVRHITREAYPFLHKLMPAHQRSIVRNEMFDELSISVLPELEAQLASIPRFSPRAGLGEEEPLMAYAHYFYGGSDWFITEYDPTEKVFFGQVILNQDSINSELGYISTEELVKNGKIELDFYWEPINLAAALHRADSSFFPKPEKKVQQKVVGKLQYQEAIQAITLGMGFIDNKKPYQEAIQTLELAMQFAA